MNITEKIDNYFNKLQKENKLLPGDKLPSYAELCDIFGISYTSVQKAFKSLERQGKIRIVHGVGSFLCGQEKLDVELYLPQSTFDFKLLKKIIEDIITQKKLHLNVILKDRVSEREGIKSLCNKRKVAIAEMNSWVRMPGTLLDYSIFDDYNAVKSKLKPYNDNGHQNLEMPFYTFTYQGLVNPNFMKKIGFTKRIDRFDDFFWWNEYIEKCKKANLLPATKQWAFHSLWYFSQALIFAIPILINQRKSSKDIISLPFFKTESGSKILNIMKDHWTWMGDNSDFMNTNVGVELCIGSWITVQHNKKFRRSKDEFRIVPYRFGNKKICHFATSYLQTFIHSEINPNEKQRVWELIKALISKPIQKKITAISGSISVRKDMKFSDHGWATRDDYRAFFPNDNDILVSAKILPMEVISALSAIYEQYEFLNVPKEDILNFMDYKIESIINKT